MEARKLGFTVVIGRPNNGGNGIKTFVTMICEREDSYAEHKKLSKSKIVVLIKCECSFRLRGYLLSTNDWSLKVEDK